MVSGLMDTDVLSYSGFRIDQMFQKLQPTVRNYNTVVLHIGTNDWNINSLITFVMH
jgi:hypothetical protein